MTAMLNEKELAGLHMTLEAPLAVIEILSRNSAAMGMEPVREDEHMALSILLSEMQPVQALVALACCGQRIAASLGHDKPLSATLSINADFILDDYGPAWLRHQNHGTEMPTHWLPEVQEDLESLADIFGVIQDSILDKTAPGMAEASALCAILADHAQAHAEMLASQLDENFFSYLGESDMPEMTQEADLITPVPLSYEGDNIIAFPLHRRH